MQILKLLLTKLDTSSDPRSLAVACFNLSQFIQYHTTGRVIVTDLKAKERVMKLMNHENTQVTKNATCASRGCSQVLSLDLHAILIRLAYCFLYMESNQNTHIFCPKKSCIICLLFVLENICYCMFKEILQISHIMYILNFLGMLPTLVPNFLRACFLLWLQTFCVPLSNRNFCSYTTVSYSHNSVEIYDISPMICLYL